MNSDEIKYRENPAMSQSILCYLIESPKSFKYRIKENSDRGYFRLGTALDCLILAKDFDEKIIVGELKPPAENTKVRAFYNKLVELIKINELSPEKDIMEYPEIFLREAFKFSEYSESTKLETALKELSKYSKSIYYELLSSNDGKILIDAKEKETVDYMANMLLTDNYTCKYFIPNNGSIEILNQVEVYGELNGVACKGLIDIVIIDHENKTIQLADLKTTGTPINGFKKSYYKYRYDIQASWYYNLFKQGYVLPGYTLLPEFNFIVVETSVFNCPLCFRADISELEGAKENRIVENRELRGWNSLLDEYKIRSYTNDWEYPHGYTERGYMKI